MKYLVTTDVETVYGTQTYRVEADSEEDAIARFRNGDGEFVEEQLEVQGMEDGTSVAELEHPEQKGGDADGGT